MPRIYLDVCCLNRPFDDQTQTRIRIEAEAVLLILARCEVRTWDWVSSDIVELEIEQTPDPERRHRVQLLASHAHHVLAAGQRETERAHQFEGSGIPAFDALHLACAETARVDVLLTTDDTLLRRSTALGEQVRVRVENPVTWLRGMD